MDPREREYDRLEAELSDPDCTEEDKKQIRRMMRELAQDASDEEKWREEGVDRGWSPY